jgi:4-oxalocrotonate tautomerase
MPIVHLQLLTGRSQQQKDEMARRIVDAVSEVGVCPPDAVQVLVTEVKKENWYVGRSSGSATKSSSKEIRSEPHSKPSFARVMQTTLREGTIEDAPPEWRKHITKFKPAGLVAAYMLVNRKTRGYLSVTLWPSEEVQTANATGSDHIAGRDAMTQTYFEHPPEPSVFEVLAVVD